MKYLSILYLIIILSVFYSCTERVEIELDSTYKRLIVYGNITTDTGVHKVTISSSSDYYSNEAFSGISGAIVEISDGSSTTILTENEILKGVYETSPQFFGVEGKTYNLRISNVDINEDNIPEEYSASATMPVLEPLDSIQLNYNKNSFFSGWEILVWAQDPGDSRDYYAFKAYKNGILLTDTLTEYIVQNDDFFNGNYTNGIVSQFLDDANPTERAQEGDTITFEINAITEDFYVYVLEAGAEASSGNPLFSGPPANISSNISNGGLGIFTCYSIDRQHAVVPAIIKD